MTVTILSDLQPAARYPAEQLIRLLTAQEPTGEEPLMAIFESALERLGNSRSHNGRQPQDVLTAGQQAAVVNAFSLAGYHGSLMIAPVTSDDERVFILPPDAFGALSDRLALEQVLQGLLQRKVWIVQRSASWPTAEPFH